MRNLVTFSQIGRYGRLCNQMYQIAGTIGIARRNGFDFAFPEWKNYDHRDRFGSTEDIDLQKYFVNSLPRYDGPPLPDHFVHWGYKDIKLSQSASLSGHMQSEKYFEHCIDEVKWYFRMQSEPALNDYCAIHVRLGDYDNAYHPRLGTEYYREAVNQFDASQKFLIFSDDLKAARYMFRESDKFSFSEGRDYLEDFKLLKTCRHFVIGNSSYSAMAAILGDAKDKRVVAPRPWFGPAATISGEDIYSSEWTVIDYKQAAAA